MIKVIIIEMLMGFLLFIFGMFIFFFEFRVGPGLYCFFLTRSFGWPEGQLSHTKDPPLEPGQVWPTSIFFPNPKTLRRAEMEFKRNQKPVNQFNPKLPCFFYIQIANYKPKSNQIQSVKLKPNLYF